MYLNLKKGGARAAANKPPAKVFRAGDLVHGLVVVGKNEQESEGFPPYLWVYDVMYQSCRHKDTRKQQTLLRRKADPTGGLCSDCWKKELRQRTRERTLTLAEAQRIWK